MSKPSWEFLGGAHRLVYMATLTLASPFLYTVEDKIILYLVASTERAGGETTSTSTTDISFYLIIVPIPIITDRVLIPLTS
jgi:hypothetical protein